MEEPLKTAIIDYISLHCEDLTVETLATHFGYSYSHFSREFKKSFHVPAVEYIATVKIQKSIEHLSPHKSILSSQLSAGYLSTGSFTNIFKKRTGLRPKDYRQGMTTFFDFFNRVAEEKLPLEEELTSDLETSNDLEVTITLPDTFKGIAFIGLFKHRLPNHVPIVGKPVTHSQTFTFKNIPDGSFYLMSCGIPKSKNLLNYFFLKDEFRSFIEEPIHFPSSEKQAFQLKLRPKLTTDPPLTINLPHILYNRINSKNE